MHRGLGIDEAAVTQGIWKGTPLWYAIAFQPPKQTATESRLSGFIGFRRGRRC
jgi:hypothetical protein